MSISQIRSQIAALDSLIDQYESTGSRHYLVDAQEKAFGLGRALEHPRETIAKLFYSVVMIPFEQILGRYTDHGGIKIANYIGCCQSRS